MEQLIKQLIVWIREQVLAAGSKGVVLGVSGGIDSSVVAVLCKQAFPDTTLAVLLPCHSAEVDAIDAGAVTAKFNISSTTIVLDKIYDSLLHSIASAGYNPECTLEACANLKSRLRMSTLYCLANQLHYLVAGTSNKSEIAIGYFTKFGDGSADILPLGDLIKKQVRLIALHLGIPKNIIEKPPSAGLWQGQTDEGEMGLNYDELDQYLVTGTANDNVKQRIQYLAKASEHKRKPIPIPQFNE